MPKVAALAIALLCVANGRDAQARPPAEPVLVDQRGAAFRLSNLRGRPVVLSFIATRCADACPITGAVFARLAQDGVGAQLVIVSLDPSYDTPFVISRYARDLHAHAPQWRVASGQSRQVDTLLNTFGVARISRDMHSTLVYCIDARGRLAKTLPLSTTTARDVRHWLDAVTNAS